MQHPPRGRAAPWQMQPQSVNRNAVESFMYGKMAPVSREDLLLRIVGKSGEHLNRVPSGRQEPRQRGKPVLCSTDFGRIILAQDCDSHFTNANNLLERGDTLGFYPVFHDGNAMGYWDYGTSFSQVSRSKVVIQNRLARHGFRNGSRATATAPLTRTWDEAGRRPGAETSGVGVREVRAEQKDLR